MDLQTRVEKLERENRHIKRVGLWLVAIIALVSVTMGARRNYAAFDWVSAHGFTIRDAAHNDRGGLHYSPTIGPFFYLRDKHGRATVKITLDGAVEASE